MAKAKPYQKYVNDNIVRFGGKEKLTLEVSATIKDLAEFPIENVHQLSFFTNVLKYILKS